MADQADSVKQIAQADAKKQEKKQSFIQPGPHHEKRTQRFAQTWIGCKRGPPIPIQGKQRQGCSEQFRSGEKEIANKSQAEPGTGVSGPTYEHAPDRGDHKHDVNQNNPKPREINLIGMESNLLIKRCRYFGSRDQMNTKRSSYRGEGADRSETTKRC